MANFRGKGSDGIAEVNRDRNANACPSNEMGISFATNSDSHLSTQGACAQPLQHSDGQENETQPKSADLLNALDDMSISGADVSHPRQYMSAIGYQTPRQTEILPGQLGDTSQDISLRRNVPFTRHDLSVVPDPSPTSVRSSPSSAPAAVSDSDGGGGTVQQSQLQMNILPSLSGQRLNNTELPVGMAEGQLSFREVPSSVSIPSAMPPQASSYFTTMPQSTDSSMICSPSSEDNTTVAGNNLSVSTAQRTPSEMTARPMSQSTNQASAASSHLSHSSSVVSLKSEISTDCLVRKLPASILKMINEEMGDNDMEASWMQLVENYGWNYYDSVRFGKRHEKDGIFLALLKADQFQTYTLSELRRDLLGLPRKDLLYDLDTAVERHNAQAQAVS